MASFDHTVYRDALSRFGDVQTVTVTQQAMSEKTNSTKRKATKSPNKGEWTNVDTTGLDAKQKAELAESLVARPRKTARAINNDAPTKQNVGQIAGKHPESVKSAVKSAKKAKPKTTPQEKRPPGRPSDYSQELADRICAELAEGKSMRTVCLAEDMPVMSTVFKWLRERKEFSEQYTKAKTESADAMVEEMIDIADDGRNDWMEAHDKDGEFVGYKVNGDHIQRSRLRVETRKWIAAKLKPKKYGEKVDLNHGVQPENPLASLLAQVAGTHMTPKPGKGDE